MIVRNDGYFGLANVLGSPTSTVVASAVIAALANQVHTSGVPSTPGGWVSLILPALLSVAGILAREGALPVAPPTSDK